MIQPAGLYLFLDLSARFDVNGAAVAVAMETPSDSLELQEVRFSRSGTSHPSSRKPHDSKALPNIYKNWQNISKKVKCTHTLFYGVFSTSCKTVIYFLHRQNLYQYTGNLFLGLSIRSIPNHKCQISECKRFQMLPSIQSKSMDVKRVTIVESYEI